MQVTRLDVGRLIVAAGVIHQGDEMGTQLRLPIPAYLIETAEERILLDTGLHPEAVRDPEGHYGEVDSFTYFGIDQEGSVADRVDLDSLTMVVLSHLHFDHAGGLDLIPERVPVVVQRSEWEAASDARSIARNFFLPRDYACLEGRATLVDGDVDLLGDGSVRLLSTPGHTPGHQSVLVEERLLIGVDVAHFAAVLDDHRFPVFGDDLARQADSATRLRGYRDEGVTVLPGHDPDLLRPGPVTW